jgi:hypothetical protein
LNVIEGKRFDSDHIDKFDSSRFYVTVKNYNRSSGLSKRINEQEDQIYDIKGPMGKGLIIK